MSVLFDLPTKPPLRWRSDYKTPTTCYICEEKEDLRGWPRVMTKNPPPWTCVCKHCIIAWYENAGTTTDEIRAYRLAEMKKAEVK